MLRIWNLKQLFGLRAYCLFFKRKYLHILGIVKNCNFPSTILFIAWSEVDESFSFVELFWKFLKQLDTSSQKCFGLDPPPPQKETQENPQKHRKTKNVAYLFHS